MEVLLPFCGDLPAPYSQWATIAELFFLDFTKYRQRIKKKKKYVNLEEADNQTIDRYRNEIAYLNKLQQHSDKIIRLYD
jgi:hypothetical protein